MQASRKSIGSLLLAAVFCLTAASASAQGLGSGLRFGTPGIGLELESLVTDHFGIRGLITGVSYNYDESSTRYDGTSRLGTGFLLADWHPYATGFRLSGGLVYNNLRFAGTAQPNGATINLNGMPYSSVGTLDGRLTFSRASPYLGVGWGLMRRPGSRLYFSADVGVLYQRPSAMLTGCGPVLPASVCTQLHAEETEFREGADDLRLYPVISVGFGLRF